MDPNGQLTPRYQRERFYPTVISFRSCSFSCYTVYDSSSYFGIVHAGKTHIPDFSDNNNDSFIQSIKLFKQALDQWLPCFSANSSNSGPTSSELLCLRVLNEFELTVSIAMPGASSPTREAASNAVDMHVRWITLGSMTFVALLFSQIHELP